MRHFTGNGKLIRTDDDTSWEVYSPAIKVEGNVAKWERSPYDYSDDLHFDRDNEWMELDNDREVKNAVKYEDDRWWDWVPSSLRGDGV